MMVMLPDVPVVLNTSDNDIVREFYGPCLSWATRYDRGVGYFTSGWLRANAKGMSIFASRGGRARWLTSPMLSSEDLEFFRHPVDELVDQRLVEVLERNVEAIRQQLEKDTLSALAWMIHDGIIEFRFAVPQGDLEGGDFHDKFGMFLDEQGNRLSFNGSQNDSQKGMVNYESFKVFTSWKGTGYFIDDDQQRFDRLWDNRDPNVQIYRLPQAVKEGILQLRLEPRPYDFPPPVSETPVLSQWRHQGEAIEVFLSTGNGVLEMATGTGKTRTALEIMNHLFGIDAITTVLVTVYGTDLLDQWYWQLVEYPSLVVLRSYAEHRDIASFQVDPTGVVLLVSRTAEALSAALKALPPSALERALIICDEVHGMGSPSIVESLSGRISPIRYRLGLSATPEREYDEAGNTFITQEIGPVVFRFGLEEAIKRGILCEFNYYALPYELTDEDRREMQRLIAGHSAAKKAGHHVKDEDLYRDLARVRKTSKAKLPVFEQFLRNNADLLKRSIIFVETMEFGELVQDQLIRHIPDYHTYYGDDERKNLVRFANGELNCLLTCHRISEGIDIRSVDNIILFSAARAKLETIQRIGRSLRTDPNNPGKRASVVDFIDASVVDDEPDETAKADKERLAWLKELATVRREE